ncbi:tubulin-tyrosine ligase [Gloeopeniophorella convolvens]|nr:tubulin-tyrosine ligase [Gloeopeniophorella convolvens]
MDITIAVSWPSAPLTDSLVRKALLALPTISDSCIQTTLPQSYNKLLQWSTYDEINHALAHSDTNRVLSSSYVIRKALIRKHFLSRCLHSYLTKHPDSVLRVAVPRTWDIEISFADELDELWADELWELSNDLESAKPSQDSRWWILKPGMADRGQGIRLFDSKESLQRILEEFEESDDDENDSGDGASPDADSTNDTSVVISQLRHFVIQEYLPNPLLLDPREIPLGDGRGLPVGGLQGHKFHLRAYCVASGDLTLYLYTRILALFSSKPYASPAHPSEGDESAGIDLAPHLTNTSLQVHRGEEGVRLLNELLGCHILSTQESSSAHILTSDRLAEIQDQIAGALAETFKAALQLPIHFQPLANAFELYGVDFLVGYVPSSPQFKIQVKLLEINAEPAIELTGPRLTWILEDLFKSMAQVCVDPFIRDVPLETWAVGETRHFLRNCLQAKVRGF